MNKTFTLLAVSLLSLGTLTTQAQFGGPGRSSGGPSFDNALGKLFGDNQTFTATLQFQTTDPNNNKTITMPGKIGFDTGKSRFEMNMADVSGGSIPPNAVAQMQQMGLDRIISITLPDKKVAYLIYPGMQSYVEIPASTTGNDAGANQLKLETVPLGKETIEGHDCVKNLVTETDNDGTKHQSTVWNATDLKKFPIKIESNEQGRATVMIFRDVSFNAPDASSFAVPAGFVKYSSPQEMMQAMIMKKMGGAMGQPPGQ